MIVLGIPTRNQFEFVFQSLLPSVATGNVLPDAVVLWDNSDGNKLPEYVNDVGGKVLAETLAASPLAGDVKFIIHGTGQNVALSNVWNTIINKCDDTDTIILSNDDLTFFPDTIEKLAKSDKEFAYPAGARAGNSFSLYKIDKKMWLDVGPFDGMFYPAYCEDNDYHHRMKLKGYDIWPVMDAEYIHVGSATIKAFTPEQMAQQHLFMRRNLSYYQYKWGGLPGKEVYTVEFNGKPYAEATELFNKRYRWQ